MDVQLSAPPNTPIVLQLLRIAHVDACNIMWGLGSIAYRLVRQPACVRSLLGTTAVRYGASELKTGFGKPRGNMTDKNISKIFL